jgi:hypothetical protein
MSQKKRSLWTWIKYFTMKWRFRLDQARAIFGLLTFAALLAVGYVNSLPWFRDQGFWRGEGLLTFIIFVVFVIGGYLYDRVFQLWSETQTVAIQRNPYSYIPGPKEEILWLGWWAYLFSAINQIAQKLDIELEGEEIVQLHMKEYYNIKPSDEDWAIKARKIHKLSRILEKSFLEKGEMPDIDTILNKLSEEIEEFDEKVIE